ncbi:type II secretion system protein N [Saccharospirillum impatiens]|uniref:type II secretion system protein N n=1 Tax=Saccharospirillum impatiens TaxID=169438 RepID=UPI000408B65A|nr:type II secretion system protein N [Saccharospirillum impatiens]
MRINLKLVVLFVAIYVITLVATVPLSWVIHYGDPILRSLGVRLEQPQGNIWQGQSQVLVPNSPELNVEWQVRPSGLFTARLPYDVRVSNAALDVSGQVQLRPTGMGVEQVSGYVDEAAFAQITQAYNSTLQGRLVMSDLSANVGWGGALGEAAGELSWSGGPVEVPMGRSRQQFDVPQMQGRISSDDSAWLVAINALDNTSLIQAELSREGQGQVTVQRAMAERLGIPVPGGRETLVEISQKVF